MRMLGLCFILSLPLMAGCEFLKHNKTKSIVAPPQDLGNGLPSSDKLIGYLNREADKLSVIESNDVSLVANVQGRRMPGLTGTMLCEKPRNFRLTGDAVATQYVDIGSNGDQFWFWVKDGDSPLYFCSYADYEKGAKLPLPFQPEWVVQALGMAKYDPAKEYKVVAKGDTYELVENTTVQGIPVRKSTIFNARNVTDPTQPQVVGHVIQNAQTGKTILHATIRRMRYASYSSPEGERSVAYPSDILLEWPEEKLSMTMKIGKATVNHKLTTEEENRYFTIPNWPNIKAVDLARLRPTGDPTSRDIRQAGGIR